MLIPLIGGDSILNIVMSLAAQETGSFTDSRDSLTYKTIKLGTHTWMAENLAYKASSGCWAYDNNQDNVITYGYLYNWETAKNVCPSGWHLPTDEEWNTLEKHLGMRSSKAKEYGIRISGTVGKKLKSTSGWLDNGNGVNSSGFTALPGGCLGYAKDFNGLGYNAMFWSASERDTSNAWGRMLNSIFDGTCRGSTHKSHGYSVRCLHN